MKKMRIGHGYDVHALADGAKLVIGGVHIEHSKGFVAHSDGDVLVHALCDALLGAMALGDIGMHFPDNSEEFKGVDSMLLLRKVMELLADKNFKVVNVDTTIVMQAPKLRPYIEKIRKRLASAMNIEVDAVSVKATTEEQLGFTGRQEGVAAHAVVLIAQLNSIA